MLTNIHQHLAAILAKKKENSAFRTLKTVVNQIDFCSNDYLGFAHAPVLKKRIDDDILKNKQVGATGSRLLTGNNELIEAVEQQIANFHNTEAALIFNSGYAANVGIFPTLARKNDYILFDELSHASTRDGIKLSKAQNFDFRHNSIIDLEYYLKQIKPNLKGNIYIAIESLYSMNGDFAPLKGIVEIAEKYDANLIVDEAHATGVIGKNGGGLVAHLGLENRILARIHTFGKALGQEGAVIVGSQILRDYLINFCRPFIFSTAPTIHKIVAIKQAYLLLEKSQEQITQLHKNIAFFRQKMQSFPYLKQHLLDSHSPIQGIVISGNENVRQAAAKMQMAGFDVRPIIAPTVAKGSERIRICLHSFNTKKQIARFVETMAMVCEK
ncbi:MAG: aminotransferase class I/II-fold pyridoxal phosphate-dependent enzyme [Chitinophagales bacterium]